MRAAVKKKFKSSTFQNQNNPSSMIYRTACGNLTHQITLATSCCILHKPATKNRTEPSQGTQYISAQACTGEHKQNKRKCKKENDERKSNSKRRLGNR